MSTPTPAAPGAMAMPIEQQILIEAFKLRYGDKGHYEATALIGLLEAADLALISQSELTRLRAQVREGEKGQDLMRRVYYDALPKFNWGKSALDAKAIKALNEFGIYVEQKLTPQPAPTEGGKL